MGDHLRRGDAADRAALRQRLSLRVAVEETGGIEITGPGGIDDRVDGGRRDLDHVVASNDHRAFGAARQAGNLASAAHCLDRFIKACGLIQRDDFVLIGEQDIDVVVDQIREGSAVPVDAETVGQGDRDLAIRRMRHLGRVHEGGFRFRRIEQIAFHIDDRRCTHLCVVNVGGGQRSRRPQCGAHGALRIRRDQDQAPPRPRAVRCRRRCEGDADRIQIVPEHLAEIIVAHLADIGAASAERGESGHRIAARPAGTFRRRPHLGIEEIGPIRTDQHHATLVQRVFGKKGVIGLHHDIDERVADTEEVEIGHIRILRYFSEWRRV